MPTLLESSWCVQVGRARCLRYWYGNADNKTPGSAVYRSHRNIAERTDIAASININLNDAMASATAC